MKTLLLSNLFPPDYDGGYEMNAWKIARGLRARGMDLEVVTSRFRPGFTPVEEEPWVHRLFELRLPVVGSPYKGIAHKVDAFRRLAHNEGMVPSNLSALRRFLKDRTYDVAYVFGLHNVGVACAYALTERNIPILWHFGDHYLAERQGYWDKSVTYRLATQTIFRDAYRAESNLDLGHTAFVSRFLLNHYHGHGVPLKETYVLPRGIEYKLGADVNRPRDEPPVILMAGRLSSDKGFHIALRAARSLLDRRPSLVWRLRIVGSGDDAYLAELKEMAAPMGDRVEFAGKLTREEVLKALSRATVFVSASVWGEPFANTIIEALGAGTPLIGSDAGSILEVVRSGESALIYPKDDPDALSQELERALDDPALRRSLAKSGVQRIAEAYTLDAILDRTEEILAEVATSGANKDPSRTGGTCR